jgi:hypothetical protein
MPIFGIGTCIAGADYYSSGSLADFNSFVSQVFLYRPNIRLFSAKNIGSQGRFSCSLLKNFSGLLHLAVIT